MLWLHDDAWKDVSRRFLVRYVQQLTTTRTVPLPQWVYPFASSIDKPNPLPPIPEGAKMLDIMRGSCPSNVPVPEGAEVYEKYGPGEGIEVGRR
jgi:hypothetical protein